MGVPQGSIPTEGSTPPQGTYAMGALAGNPNARRRTVGAARLRPPPTDPGAPMWSAPPAPGARRPGAAHHRVRNGLLAGAAALAVLGGGHRHRPRHHSDNGRAPGLRPVLGQHAAALGFGLGSGNPSGSARRTVPFGNGRRTRAIGNSGNRQLRQRQLGLVQLVWPERRQRHRLEGRPGTRRHQHDARLPAGAGGRNGHRALVQRRDPDQQPRDRRRHEHQRHRHRQPEDLHRQRGGLRPHQGHRGAAAAQRLGPPDRDPRQLVATPRSARTSWASATPAAPAGRPARPAGP